MKIISLPELEASSRRAGPGERASVAVGTFDGVHLGHRAVIEGAHSVLTFEPHPVSIVAPAHTPKLLTRPRRKAELIASLGVQELIVIPFDAQFARRSAKEFIDHVLVGALAARRVSVGENFRFGHKAQGDARMLASDGRFEAVVHPLLEVDGEIVSSSHIRGLLLTLKLIEWDLAAEIPAYLNRIRSWGYPKVAARQLQHNRQEICVAARRKDV